MSLQLFADLGWTVAGLRTRGAAPPRIPWASREDSSGGIPSQLDRCPENRYWTNRYSDDNALTVIIRLEPLTLLSQILTLTRGHTSISGWYRNSGCRNNGCRRNIDCLCTADQWIETAPTTALCIVHSELCAVRHVLQSMQWFALMRDCRAMAIFRAAVSVGRSTCHRQQLITNGPLLFYDARTRCWVLVIRAVETVYSPRR